MLLRFFVCILWGFGVCAADLSPKTLAEKVEVYLNGIQALKADFLQTNPSGTILRGRLWLQRTPGTFGKLRLDYEPKAKQRIISVDENLTIYDLSDNSETNISVSSTPAAFILQQAISLQKDLRVASLVVSDNADFVKVKLVRQGDDDGGPSLTLFFSLYGTGGLKTLERWEVVDMQGNETRVDLLPETLTINSTDLVSDAVFRPPFQEEIVTSTLCGE
jgi:outer membrane lipoprotein-sorting protein